MKFFLFAIFDNYLSKINHIYVYFVIMNNLSFFFFSLSFELLFFFSINKSIVLCNIFCRIINILTKMKR